MSKNPDINQNLRKGDQVLIAEMTGYTEKYVNMVLRGLRNSPKIIEAAKMVIANREELIEKYQSHS